MIHIAYLKLVIYPDIFIHSTRRTITQSANYSHVRQQTSQSSISAAHKIRFLIVFIYSSTNDPVFHDLHLQQHKPSDSYWYSRIAAKLIHFSAVFIFSSTSNAVPRVRHLFPLVQMLCSPMYRLMYIGKISKLCTGTNPLPHLKIAAVATRGLEFWSCGNTVLLTGNNDRRAFFILSRKLNYKRIFFKFLVER